MKLLSLIASLLNFLGEKEKIESDLKTIENVMRENISTDDYTALSLVRERMITHGKRELPRIEEVLERILSYDEYLNGFEAVRSTKDRLNAVNSRPKRTRKAPQRLNITTTKGGTYQ